MKARRRLAMVGAWLILVLLVSSVFAAAFPALGFVEVLVITGVGMTWALIFITAVVVVLLSVGGG